MERDIKETKEMIAGLEKLAIAGKKIRDIVADGIGADDLAPAFELIKEEAKNAAVYSEAVKDSSLILEEIKNLSKEELIELVMKVVSAISVVEKA